MASSTTTTNQPSPPDTTSGRTAFFYGTLMAPAVLHRVCHGSSSPTNPIFATHNLHSYPALLPSHRRHRVKAADYPGIIPTPNSNVRGTLVTGLTDADIWRLDIFEGTEYAREKVKCRVLNEQGEEMEGGEIEAETYIWISGREGLEEGEWDFEEFKREKMQFWVGAEREDYAEVDEAVAAAEKEGQKQDGTRGRGAGGHIGIALKEEQEKTLHAAV